MCESVSRRAGRHKKDATPEVGPLSVVIAADGTISVSGPQIAGLMTKLGLIDEYHLVLRPFVLGQGKPFFHDARPPLRWLSTDQLDDETVCLVYEPA